MEGLPSLYQSSRKQGRNRFNPHAGSGKKASRSRTAERKEQRQAAKLARQMHQKKEKAAVEEAAAASAATAAASSKNAKKKKKRRLDESALSSMLGGAAAGAASTSHSSAESHLARIEAERDEKEIRRLEKLLGADSQAKRKQLEAEYNDDGVGDLFTMLDSFDQYGSILAIPTSMDDEEDRQDAEALRRMHGSPTSKLKTQMKRPDRGLNGGRGAAAVRPRKLAQTTDEDDASSEKDAFEEEDDEDDEEDEDEGDEYDFDGMSYGDDDDDDDDDVFADPDDLADQVAGSDDDEDDEDDDDESGGVEDDDDESDEEDDGRDQAARSSASAARATPTPAATGAVYVPPHKRKTLQAGETNASTSLSSSASKAQAVAVVPAVSLSTSSSSSSAAALAKVGAVIQGQLNRLTQENIEPIVNSLAALYQTGQTGQVDLSQTLCEKIEGQLGDSTQVLTTQVTNIAAVICALHWLVGTRIGAFCLERLTLRLDRLLAEDGMPSANATRDQHKLIGSKLAHNVLLLLVQLYNFGLIDCTYIYDVIRVLCGEDKSDTDGGSAAPAKGKVKKQKKGASGGVSAAAGLSATRVELLLLLLRSCGRHLRRDDSRDLVAIIDLVEQRCRLNKDDARVAYMLNVLRDLKKKKGRQESLAYEEAYTPLLRWLTQYRASVTGQTKARGQKRKRIGASTSETATQLRVRYRDFIEASTRGRWWLVGSAWAGGVRDGSVSSSGSASAAATAAPAGPVDIYGRTSAERDSFQKATQTAGRTDKDKDAAAAAAKQRKQQQRQALESVGMGDSDLLRLAARQRMTTESRRALFCVIMSADDYVDCFDKLTKLNLKDAADRDCARVLIDCCAQERAYNPYYAAVADRLISHYPKRYRFTFQLALWDAFKLFDSASGGGGGVNKADNLRRVHNTARFTAHLLARASLPLTCLKAFTFDRLQRGAILFLMVALQTVLAEPRAVVEAVFRRVADVRPKKRRRPKEDADPYDDGAEPEDMDEGAGAADRHGRDDGDERSQRWREVRDGLVYFFDRYMPPKANVDAGGATSKQGKKAQKAAASSDAALQRAIQWARQAMNETEQ